MESCHFFAAVGDMAKPEMKQGANVLFKNKVRNRVDRPFYGNLADREQFKKVSSLTSISLYDPMHLSGLMSNVFHL